MVRLSTCDDAPPIAMPRKRRTPKTRGTDAPHAVTTPSTSPSPSARRAPDPDLAALWTAKALARTGELPGCRCYLEMTEQEARDAGPCEHVTLRVADALREAAERKKKRAAKKPASQIAAKHDRAMASLLDAEIARLYQIIESDEPIEDDELDKIEVALEHIEMKRALPVVPSMALTKEALVAVYGERYDDRQHLWCATDAVQRQGQRASLEAARKEDHRFGRMEVALATPDGKVRVVERAVVQGEGGTLKVIGEQDNQQGEAHV